MGVLDQAHLSETSREVVVDTRKHRGPHPQDVSIFAPSNWSRLQQSVRDYCWLISNGYAENASLKLVGDRFQLTARARMAVFRSSCSDAAEVTRQQRELPPAKIAGMPLEVDGFNLLMTIEAALSGGFIIAGRDGCYRDMASVHGTYRAVQETRQAIAMVADCHRSLDIDQMHWLFDQPVSNSGRLAVLVARHAEQSGLNWITQLVPNPDLQLTTTTSCVVSADSYILDHCSSWVNLARYIISQRIPETRVVPMYGGAA